MQRRRGAIIADIARHGAVAICAEGGVEGFVIGALGNETAFVERFEKI